MSAPLPSFAGIEAAAGRIAGAVSHTPTIKAAGLSAALGLDLSLKLETLQRTGSFKERGALNRLLFLSEDECRRGVIAMSAGNHAQGVAYHAQRLGIPATIVMPETTPFNKIERTASFGARVVLRGADLSQSSLAAHEMAASEGFVFVHPYDDVAIIEGQGTAALELLADSPDIEVLVVPVGGGGLIAGMALAAKTLKPSIEVIGVETEQFPSMHRALAGLPLPAAGRSLAEGIAVTQPGVLTLPLVRQWVDEIVLVTEPAIEQAVELLMTRQRLVAEGAGAAGIAAVMADPERFRGRKIATPLCGGNIDPSVLAAILLRGMVQAGRLVRLRARIDDTPGTLARISRIIGDLSGNIVEISHQRLFHSLSVKVAELEVTCETRGPEHVAEILRCLEEAGFPSELLSGEG